jgi:hypothetical protein
VKVDRLYQTTLEQHGNIKKKEKFSFLQRTGDENGRGRRGARNEAKGDQPVLKFEGNLGGRRVSSSCIYIYKKFRYASAIA